MLEYEKEAPANPSRLMVLDQDVKPSGGKAIAAIGAGNFGKTMIVPALKADGRVQLKTLVTSRGVSAEGTGTKLGFANATTDMDVVLVDPDVAGLVITTPHSTHASMVTKGLQANKHIFVEKPLALTHEELDRVVTARNASSGFVMVGFNRRFAPYVQDAKKFLASKGGVRSSIFG